MSDDGFHVHAEHEHAIEHPNLIKALGSPST